MNSRREFEASHFQWRQGRPAIGEVLLEEIVDLAGSPLFVYDLGRVRQNIASLRSALGRRVDLFYAVKAAANVELLRVVAAAGLGLDVCSPGDLAFAAAAGFDDTRLSYVGFAMTRRELDTLAARAIHPTLDSVEQLRAFGERAPGRTVGLRLNPQIAVGFHPDVVAGAPESKFGIDLEELPACRTVAARHGLTIDMLHAHLGSDLLDPSPHLELLDRLLEVASSLPTVNRLSLGGGIGIPFTADEQPYDLEALGRGIAERVGAHPRSIGVVMELGTYVVRSAGYLVCTVHDVKDGTSCRVVGVDASVALLPSVQLYGTQHPMAVCHRAPLDVEAPHSATMVAGHLMLGGDVLRRPTLLPRLHTGDVIAFGLAGAYSAARASTFNERPLPAEVAVDGREVIRIRAAQSTEDLLQHQRAERLG